MLDTAHQQPHEVDAMSEPLTVLCTLLSRADNAPLDQRRKGPLQMLDLCGEVLGDPASTPNAFETDPNLNFEKWAEYWRKTHAPRFIHALPVEADGSYPLLRYDQIHRLSAGPSSLRPLPYTPPLGEGGQLFDTVIGHVPPYQRPDWDGIAYLGFADADALQVTFGHEEITRAIFPEDQVIFRELCPVLCSQHVLIPSATSRESILLISLVRRDTSLNREQFHQRWLHDFAPQLLTLAATQRFVRRYVQLHNIGPTEAGLPLYHEHAKDIDAISITAFDSITDLEDYLADPHIKALLSDQNHLIVPEQHEYWAALAFQVINQCDNETRTA